MDSENLIAELNGDFEFDFVEVDELSGEKPGDTPNRELAASERAGLRSFNARTQTVQWGKYDGNDAVLLVFGLSFVYQDTRSHRMTQAHITVSFEEVIDPAQRELNLQNSPIIRRIGPLRWERYAHEEARAPIRLILDPEVTVSAVTARLGSVETQLDRSKRRYSVKMQANSATSPGQEFHVDEATWTVSSTGTRDIGIVRDFKIALIVEAPRDPASTFCAYMYIETSMGTVIDRILRKDKLRSKIKRPVLLDRKTPKPKDEPCSYGTIGQDFHDASFPWADLGLVPTEDEVSNTYAKA